jgi:hypothetical protein
MYPSRKPSGNIKDRWDNQRAEYESDLTQEELQQFGGSQRYGHGGRWDDGRHYFSIGGYRSRGGMPLKLKTGDGFFMPISGTDCEELLKEKLIRRIPF